MIERSPVTAGTALSPEWDRWFDEAFAELVAGHDDMVRAEFDALIAANWPPPPEPPAPSTPRPPRPRRPNSSLPMAATSTGLRRRVADGPVGGGPRSPPAAAT